MRIMARRGAFSEPAEKVPVPRKKRGTNAERAEALRKKQKYHDTYVRRTYNLDAGEYALLLAKQGGGCAICGKKPRKRFLAVDHNHETGQVRGLLCLLCNTALGVWEFDKAAAERASAYLARVAADFVPAPDTPKDSDWPPPDDLPF